MAGFFSVLREFFPGASDHQILCACPRILKDSAGVTVEGSPCCWIVLCAKEYLGTKFEQASGVTSERVEEVKPTQCTCWAALKECVHGGLRLQVYVRRLHYVKWAENIGEKHCRVLLAGDELASRAGKQIIFLEEGQPARDAVEFYIHQSVEWEHAGDRPAAMCARFLEQGWVRWQTFCAMGWKGRKLPPTHAIDSTGGTGLGGVLFTMPRGPNVPNNVAGAPPFEQRRTCEQTWQVPRADGRSTGDTRNAVPYEEIEIAEPPDM